MSTCKYVLQASESFFADLDPIKEVRVHQMVELPSEALWTLMQTWFPKDKYACVCMHAPKDLELELAQHQCLRHKPTLTCRSEQSTPGSVAINSLKLSRDVSSGNISFGGRSPPSTSSFRLFAALTRLEGRSGVEGTTVAAAEGWEAAIAKGPRTKGCEPACAEDDVADGGAPDEDVACLHEGRVPSKLVSKQTCIKIRLREHPALQDRDQKQDQHVSCTTYGCQVQFEFLPNGMDWTGPNSQLVLKMYPRHQKLQLHP